MAGHKACDSWCPCRAQVLAWVSLKIVHIWPLIEIGPKYLPCVQARESGLGGPERRKGCGLGSGGWAPIQERRCGCERKERKPGPGERRGLVTALSMASSAPTCRDPPPLRLLKDCPATSCYLYCLAESPESLLSQPGSSDFPGSGLLPNQPRPSSIRVWGM